MTKPILTAPRMSVSRTGKRQSSGHVRPSVIENTTGYAAALADLAA
ncbi:MAG TPA: hypothetical protein VFN67_06755 [Polyangiales bacterium]|nr:hypothetical protein [Polyangiales bacterium]